MIKNKTMMTYVEAAEYASKLMGREIRFLSGSYVFDPEDRHLQEIFKDKGAVGRVCDDGSVDVILDTQRLYGGNPLVPILRQAVFNVALIKGIDGFFSSQEQYKTIARQEGLLTGHMSDKDLRAFACSCVHADSVDLRLARKILQVSFETDDFPFGLEKQFVGGLKNHRKRRIQELNFSGDEIKIKDFAKETMSRYSYHKHLHLGFPAHAMYDMGYPEQEIFVDISKVVALSNELNIVPQKLLDLDFVAELRNPICVFNRNQVPGYVNLVLNIRDKEGKFVTAEVLGPKDSCGYNGTKIVRFGRISPSALWKNISFTQIENGKVKYPNTFHLRPSDEPEYVFDIVRVLKNLGTKEKTSGNHRIDSCEYEFVTALNFDAKILQFFENPKNIKDFNKNNDVVISIPVGIPQETVPGVIVREDTDQSFISEKSASPEKNLTDPATKIKESEKDFVSLRLDDIKNALALLRKDVAQGSILMPRDVNGVVFRGSDTHYLFCRMATTQQWKGCPVFIPESALKTFGLSACEAACLAFSVSCGENVYNLMDTDMSPLLKKEILMLIQEKPKAVPAEVVTQVLSFCADTDLSSDQVRDIENIWASSPVVNANEKIGQPLEDILYPARKKVEKHIDPKKALQKYGFPEAIVTELIDKGDVCYKGPILTRPDNGISTPQQRMVNIRLRILDGEARLCTPAGNPVGNSLMNALKDVKLDAATLGRVDRYFAERKAAVQAPEKTHGRKPGE